MGHKSMTDKQLGGGANTPKNEGENNATKYSTEENTQTHTHTLTHARNTQNTSEIESEGKMTGLFHSINGIYHAMETGK